MTWPGVVWKLLRVRWWVFLSGLRRSRGRSLIRYILYLIVVLILIGGTFVVSWMIFSFMRSPQIALMAGAAALENIPITMLMGAFAVVFLLSFQVLLQGLYLAGDMDFLLCFPIPARAVFVAKLLEAILPNFLLLAMFMLPVLWGLGVAGRYSLLYYPLSLMMLALQALAAAGLSAMMVMAIVRIFPARRVFEVLSFVGVMLGMLCSQWYNLSRAYTGGREPEVLPAFVGITGALGRFNSPWLPLAWPGLGLLALAQGRWWAAAGYLSLSSGLAVGIFLFALAASERLYYSGWARVRAAPAQRVQRRATTRRTRKVGRVPFLPPPVSGILLKDLRMLRRDLRNLSQLIGPVIFALVYAFMFLSRGSALKENDVLAGWVEQYAVYGTVLITLFACWGLASHLARLGFSLEGRYYWVLRAAPVSAGQLALAKWLAAFLPAIGVGSALMIGIGAVQRAAPGDWLFGWCAVAFIVAGTTGWNLAVGIVTARLDWTDPRRMGSGASGCLIALIDMAFQGISLMLFLGPPVAAGALELPPIVGELVGLGLGGTLCAIVAVLPPWLARKKIPTIGENGA